MLLLLNCMLEMPWLILLSTLSRLANVAPSIVAELWPESMERWWWSARYSGACVAVGETMWATLMLGAVGEMTGWFVDMWPAMGEGVLSVDDWYPEAAGLRPWLLKDADDVSATEAC